MSRPPYETFTGATCKGCYALGTACGHCEKCAWERSQPGFEMSAAPSVRPKDCKHEDLHCHVNLNHILDTGVVYLEARVRCKLCGIPFEFQGLTAGLSAYKPHVDVTAQELFAPMFPRGSKLLPGIPGFEVRFQ